MTVGEIIHGALHDLSSLIFGTIIIDSPILSTSIRSIRLLNVVMTSKNTTGFEQRLPIMQVQDEV